MPSPFNLNPLHTIRKYLSKGNQRLECLGFKDGEAASDEFEIGDSWWDGLDLENAHDKIAEMMSRYQIDEPESSQYSEIFLLPVVVSRQPGAVEATLVWESARENVRNALVPWFSAATKVTLFQQLIPQEWISGWDPIVLRAHLNRLSPHADQGTFNFHPEILALPEGFPRLHFIVVGASHRKAWPEVQELAAKQTQVSLATLRDCLDPNTCDVMPWDIARCQVMPPAQVRDSIPSGVHQWLHSLHQQASLAGWVLNLDPQNSDRIAIKLQFVDSTIPDAQLVLRIYQIGSSGVQRVLSSLASLAPNLEVPVDCAL